MADSACPLARHATALRGRGAPLRPLLCLAVLLGVLAYLVPLAAAAGAVDPIPLARCLRADHGPAARRHGADVPVPGAPVERPGLARPAPPVIDRADQGAASRPSAPPCLRSDLSRSPPAR
jgi:hypothetical protein